MELGPLEILYSWQSVLLAIVITSLTQGAKALIDVKFGGTSSRRRSKILGRLVLPAIPLVFGLLLGMLVPLRPDVLQTYITLHPSHALAIGACYGVSVGQFADYLYQRLMDKKTQAPHVPDQGEN